VLQLLKQDGNNIAADIKNLVADRLRVNKLVLKVALWVASAAARRVELWDDAIVLPLLPPLSSSRLLSLLAQPNWRSATSCWTSCCPTVPARGGGGRGDVFRGCLPAAARRGRAAPGAAAAGRRRQASARCPELVLERLSRALTAGSSLPATKSDLSFISLYASLCPCRRLQLTPRQSPWAATAAGEQHARDGRA
jgi:hypothetical protein